MPMNFPDMKSLKEAARVWEFREANEDETEGEYRRALADFVSDPIESMEIRTGKGWDKWSGKERLESMVRAMEKFPMSTD